MIIIKNLKKHIHFLKIVQNKLHYAITGKTAAELIFERVNNEKDNMGLTNWKNSPDGKIIKYDVSIAKNYLDKDEIKKLENLTEMFLINAETETLEQRTLTMSNWINVTDDLLKYRIKQDKLLISSMDELYDKYLKEGKK